MFGLGSLGFADPWLLTALLLLPLIWWLLRITPPAPREVLFPAIRLLFGLNNEEQTPQSSPLWLILIRLAVLAALIVGLAGPLINPQGTTRGSGPLLMVIDDGWAAAADWSRRTTAMEAMVARAEREKPCHIDFNYRTSRIRWADACRRSVRRARGAGICSGDNAEALAG